MPKSKYTDAEKLAILAEHDATPRGYGAGGKKSVCEKYQISVQTPTLWRARVKKGELAATAAEIAKAKEELSGQGQA